MKYWFITFACYYSPNLPDFIYRNMVTIEHPVLCAKRYNENNLGKSKLEIIFFSEIPEEVYDKVKDIL